MVDGRGRGRESRVRKGREGDKMEERGVGGHRDKEIDVGCVDR